MRIRILLVAALLVAGCSKPPVAPSPVGAPPPSQAAPAPASQQTAAKDAPAVAQAANVAPAAASVPTPAAQDKPKAVEYLGIGCGQDSYGGPVPAFAERVKFAFSDDTATMTIIESEPLLQGSKFPLTLNGSLHTDEKGPNWDFMTPFDNLDNPFLHYLVRPSLQFHDALLALAWRNTAHAIGEVFTAAPQPDLTIASAEFWKAEIRDFRRPLAWHLNPSNDKTCFRLATGFYSDARSEK